MDIVEQMLGGMMGGGDTSTSRLQGTLMTLLGGGAQPAGMAGTAPQPGGAGVMAGGLAGLVGQFEQAGLGHIVQSWIGTGDNHPVSPDQLQSVFGERQVSRMAEQAGMPTQDLLAQLAQHLPGLVDGMTPQGRLPDAP